MIHKLGQFPEPCLFPAAWGLNMPSQLGSDVGQPMYSGNQNVMIGYNAGVVSTGNNCIAIGSSAYCGSVELPEPEIKFQLPNPPKEEFVPLPTELDWSEGDWDALYDDEYGEDEFTDLADYAEKDAQLTANAQAQFEKEYPVPEMLNAGHGFPTEYVGY